MARRVKANCTYHYVPVPIDRMLGVANPPAVGSLVRVVNLHGCPKANTMDHCHIEHPETGEFFGLVHCNSLVPKKEYVAA